MNKVLSLLEKANKKADITVEFELEIFDETVKMLLGRPQMKDIWEAQAITNQLKVAELKEKGFGNFPINQDEWNESLDTQVAEYKETLKKDGKSHPEVQALGAEFKQSLMKQKPRNLAEQQAASLGRFSMITEIIPNHLRDAETGEYLFRTPEAAKMIKQFLGANQEAMKAVSEAYLKLNQKIDELSPKNSKVGQSGKTSESKPQ